LLYEELKKRRNLNGTPTQGRTIWEWTEYFGCAALAKCTAAILTYPHEVIRTRLRESPSGSSTSKSNRSIYKYNGFVQTGRLIVHEEGLRALYGGISVHLMRTVPNAAIMFLCFEGAVHFANSWVQSD
jgi:solute carrier family 25 protein 33/36